jgi:hypothetical protein
MINCDLLPCLRSVTVAVWACHPRCFAKYLEMIAATSAIAMLDFKFLMIDITKAVECGHWHGRHTAVAPAVSVDLSHNQLLFYTS